MATDEAKSYPEPGYAYWLFDSVDTTFYRTRQDRDAACVAALARCRTAHAGWGREACPEIWAGEVTHRAMPVERGEGEAYQLLPVEREEETGNPEIASR